MAKVTPGFKLYLYRLLSQQIGFGKQTLLPQVEEVLAADDIIPADLECDTIQEVVQACPEFLKLTVFKKGRAYATVLVNEEWDRMLVEPVASDKPAPAKKAGTRNPKTWKKKKNSKKILKPVKPGKQRRDREAAEAERRAVEEAARAEREAAEAAAKAEQEAAEAERRAAEEAAKAEREAVEAAAKAGREAAEAAEKAGREATGVTAESEHESAKTAALVERKADEDAAGAEREAAAVATKPGRESGEAFAQAEREISGAAAQPGLEVVNAAVQAGFATSATTSQTDVDASAGSQAVLGTSAAGQTRFDASAISQAMLGTSAAGQADFVVSGAMHTDIEAVGVAADALQLTPDTTGTSAVGSSVPQGDMNVVETLHGTAAASVTEAVMHVATESVRSAAEAIVAGIEAGQIVSGASASDSPTPAGQSQTQSTAPTSPTFPEHAAHPQIQPTAPASPVSSAAVPSQPAAPAPEPISLTITYNPYEDMERELARQAAEREAQQAAAPFTRSAEFRAEQQSSYTASDFSGKSPAASTEPSSAFAPKPSPISLAGLPQDFGTEVSCKDALLRALYHLLPYEVEPMAILDEDWRVARSTGTLSGSRNRVTFPLRYLHEDGTPLTVTLRKAPRSAYAKPWNLALVDGDDGSGQSHASVGFEGLPAADEGAWADLTGMPVDPAISPQREMAQQMVIGSWDAILGSLAATVAPERWNYPGEGVGRQSRYGILREYLTLTYHRVRCQERIAESDDGSFAAFNTGLLTSFGEDIYACMTARKGDIPWQFAGFATAGSGELGARLTGTISELPIQASYLSTLESVVASQDRMVILDLDALITRQLGRLPRAFLSELLEGNVEAQELLARESTLSSQDLTQLARMIKQSSTTYRRLRRSLDDAVEQSMRSVRASYRLVVPVYDPAENRTKLLMPLCLVEEGQVDCALVLDLQPSGAYRAAAILSLPRAYACARVISREQPTWLSAERVLGK